MKREEKKTAIRQQIINAAYDLMTKQGIKATGIRQVSEKSGISSVTMYKYFATKEELAEAVGLKVYKEHVAKSLEFSTNDQMTFVEKLKTFGQYSQEIQKKFAPSVGAEFFNLFNSSSEIKNYVQNWEDEFWGGIIQSGREAGNISSKTSDEAIKIFANMFITYLAQNSEQAEKLLPQLENLFQYGISGDSNNNLK